MDGKWITISLGEHKKEFSVLPEISDSKERQLEYSLKDLKKRLGKAKFRVIKTIKRTRDKERLCALNAYLDALKNEKIKTEKETGTIKFLDITLQVVQIV